MPNPRLEPDAETVRLSLSIGPQLVAAVDAARGKTPRSAYLRQALEEKLNRPASPPEPGTPEFEEWLRAHDPTG